MGDAPPYVWDALCSGSPSHKDDANSSYCGAGNCGSCNLLIVDVVVSLAYGGTQLHVLLSPGGKRP